LWGLPVLAGLGILSPIMGRRIIAALASLMLLCAALVSAAAPLRGLLADAPLVAVIDTADGISLEESVIDDLRPSALQDAPSSALFTDQLPQPVWLAWDLADRARTWARPQAERLPAWPYLGGLMRPPSSA
jgi:hypothetical protein